MATTTLHHVSSHHTLSHSLTSVFTNFINWCTAQQSDRLLWLAIAIAAHGCVLAPLTGMAVAFTGNNQVLLALTISSMAGALLVNLAALPTKITIPVFLLSIVIDVMILLTCLYTAVTH